MTADQEYDVAVIGSGAGGGTLAYELAQDGKSVLILERGSFVTREPKNWDPAEVFGKGRYVSDDTWTDNRGQPFHPQAHYNVGGATKFYGAALYRLRPSDFEARAFHDGVTGEWPFGYTDLEPYYTAAEHLYQVHGNHGEDPTEGHASEDYPFPALSHEPYIQRLSDHLASRGLHPFHSPNGVKLADRPEMSECVRCQFCDGHPCPLLAKADAESIAIRPMLRMPHVTLKVGMRVVSLKMSERRVTAIVAQTKDGTTHEFRARQIVLAAGAVNSAAILLRSGIGNNEVGRHYTAHTSKALIAVGEEPNDTVFQKTLGLNDWYHEFGNVQMLGKSNAAAMRGESRLARLFPTSVLSKVASHAVDFWLTTEDVGLAENRVTLGPDGGVKLSYTPTNVYQSASLARRLRNALGHGYVVRHMDIPLAAVAHQAGTLRMGATEHDSVTDHRGMVWGTDNLRVVDASALPSIGAVNPALTVMANAMRVADHVEELI